MSRRCLCLFAGVLLLAAAPGLAQTTGAIQGQVTDHEDQALPGVTVVLSGDPIPGAQRTIITDAEGEFQYMALPVGRYSLSAALDGFSPQSVENVRVPIDGTASVIFRLQPGAFVAEIAVTGESPLVDVVSSSVMASYDAEFIEDLPTRNNFYDILAVAPAVSQPNEGNILIAGYGANMSSQSWNIDGQGMTSPGGGWIVVALNPDMIAETSFLQGAGAQYGSTLGNVWNVVTKSGTNNFHGSLATVFRHDDLVDPNVTLDPSEWADYRLHDPGGEYVIDEYYDVSGTLGGPIARDKLWFFAGVQISERRSVQPDAVPFIPGTGYEADRYDLKITAQPGKDHRLDIKGHATDWYSAGSPSMYQEAANINVEDPENEMLLVDYNGVLSESTLLNARAGTWTVTYDRYSLTGAEPGTFYADIYTGPALAYGGPWWLVPREEEADQADLILSHFADEFIKGSHEFKFGVQYYQGSDIRRVVESTYSWVLDAVGYFSQWYPRYYQSWGISPEFFYGAEIETHGAFFDDSWKISDRLTIDVGVRWDRQQGRIPDLPKLEEGQYGNPTGEIIPGTDMIDWENFAPRLGFAWQPTGSGKTVIRGFYGRFWDGPTASAWYAPPPGRGPSDVWFDYPWPGYQVYSQPVVAADELLDPNAKNPYSDEFALSFDHQIGRNYAIGGQLVYKTTDDIIGWQIEGDGVYAPFIWDDPYTSEVEQIELVDVVVWPTLHKGNGPGPGSFHLPADQNYFMEYRGAVLTFRKRYSDGWDLMASYTWSNIEGISPRPRDRFAGSIGQGLPLFTEQVGSQPNDWYNIEHRLQGDREHMFRIQSNVDIGWGMRLSGVLNVQSGRPWWRTALVYTPTFNPITITADAGDHLRLPDQAILDLGLQKTFALGKGVDFDIALQVLNALNEDAVEYWSSWRLNPGEELEGGHWVSPRRLQVKFKLAF
jgi:hypothetical protein